MTPQQALHNIATMIVKVETTLANHQALQESLRVLSEAVKKLEPETK
jgi:hypothetical protein